MALPFAFFREAGVGPGVVCLHSNAGSSSQWRGLLDTLSPKYRVFAPDSYGAGKSVDWASDRVIALKDEVAFIEPVFAAAGAPFSLVGHSYGAAVALIAALANPRRVQAMALYEPTLFSLIDEESPSPKAAHCGIDHQRSTLGAHTDWDGNTTPVHGLHPRVDRIGWVGATSARVVSDHGQCRTS
jgi:pimeloyl-ACP methyl ester carboxylesterase